LTPIPDSSVRLSSIFILKISIFHRPTAFRTSCSHARQNAKLYTGRMYFRYSAATTMAIGEVENGQIRSWLSRSSMKREIGNHKTWMEYRCSYNLLNVLYVLKHYSTITAISLWTSYSSPLHVNMDLWYWILALAGRFPAQFTLEERL
jgi:hypothetical protein